MRLYIIGNGFDLNHGMKTSYNDYKQFLGKFYPGIFYEYEHFNYLSLVSSDNSRWADIEYALSIDYDAMMDDALQYYPDYMDDRDSKWGAIKIDTESKTEFIKAFTGECFGDWLCGFMTIEAKRKFALDKTDFYLTFNYTDTLEQVYGISSEHILHIHGQFSRIKNVYNNPMVRKEIQFGTPHLNSEEVYNELENRYGRDDFFSVSIEPGIRDICKFIEKSSKSLQGNYEKLNSFLCKKEITEVIVMGHSLNSADYAYYSDILLPKLRDKMWIFYMRDGDTATKADIDEFILRSKISDYRFKKW